VTSTEANVTGSENDAVSAPEVRHDRRTVFRESPGLSWNYLPAPFAVISSHNFLKKCNNLGFSFSIRFSRKSSIFNILYRSFEKVWLTCFPEFQNVNCVSGSYLVQAVMHLCLLLFNALKYIGTLKQETNTVCFILLTFLTQRKLKNCVKCVGPEGTRTRTFEHQMRFRAK